MRESHQFILSETFPAHEATNRTHAVARISPVAWLNLVCLDAPLVAITWQWFFARDFHISLTASARAALFLTAWLIYLADRMADVWALPRNSPRSLRQEFCQSHQRPWIAAIAGIALLDFWIIVHHLDPSTIRVGMFIGVALLIYLAINYWLGKTWRFLPIKEICVGSLFAIGTVAALLPRIDLFTRFAMLFVLFAALCSLNCIGIAIWEQDLDRAQRKNSIATRWSASRSLFRLGAPGLIVLAIALGTKTSAQMYFCVSVSAALLVILDWLGERIPRDERTALADLVLLTPLLLLALGPT